MLVDPAVVHAEWAKLVARATLAHTCAVSARLASLRYRLFDEKCQPTTRGLHDVLVQVAAEIEANA